MRTAPWNIFNLRRATLIAGHVVAMALLLGWILRPSAIERLLQTRPENVSLPPMTQLTARPPLQLESVQSRALFHAARTFYVPPPPPSGPVELKPPPPPYRVATVLTSRGQSPLALLTDAHGKGVLKIRAGDMLAGWTVESVAPRRVILVFSGDRIELGPKLSTPGETAAGMTGSTAPAAVRGSSPSSGLTHTTLLSAGHPPGPPILGPSSVAAGAGHLSGTARLFQPPPQ